MKSVQTRKGYQDKCRFAVRCPGDFQILAKNLHAFWMLESNTLQSVIYLWHLLLELSWLFKIQRHQFW